MRRTIAAVLLAASVAPFGLRGQEPGGRAGASLDPAMLRRVDHLADSLVRLDQFAGVILIASAQGVEYHKAFGLADRERRRPVDTASAFNLSSLGKLFTQAAVQQLVAAGRLRLDASILEYWPDYPNPDVGRQVTVRHLLEHTSGIGGSIFVNPERRRANSDYVDAFVHLPLQFQPGSREEYSNAGYVVLGEIIARASGMPYERYIADSIFARAGMTRSGFFSRDALPDFAAVGYTRLTGPPPAPTDGPLRSNASLQPVRGSAAGGSYATAHSLWKFLEASRDGRFRGGGGNKGMVIGGGSPGSNTSLATGIGGNGITLIVLSNLDPPSARQISDAIEALVRTEARTGQRQRIVN